MHLYIRFCGRVRHTMKNVWKSHVLSLLFIEQKTMSTRTGCG